MIYVLAYPRFEQSCAEHIADFRAIHEPQRAKLVPPHITLVFGSAEKHLEAISHLVEAVSSQTKSFAVSFDDWAVEFDPFEKKHKMFLLCKKGSDEATSLHNRLYEGIHRAELDTAHPFKPHMTIATYNKRAEIEQVDVSFAGELPISAKLRALELVRVVEGKLKVVRTTPFSQ
ncbi:MAG: 2'-5' RNA ligase family protein [Pseudomonadota bacterium]